MGGELFYQTLDLVQCTFCHVLLLPKDSVYCTTRSTPPRGLPTMRIGGRTAQASTVRGLLCVGCMPWLGARVARAYGWMRISAAMPSPVCKRLIMSSERGLLRLSTSA